MKIIAVIWDFDKTLISGYMQAPLFEHYSIDGARFWDEVNALPGYFKEEFKKHGPQTSKEQPPLYSDFLYLNHILTYVRHGIFVGLNNALLRELGAKLRMAPGVPEIFDDIARFAGEQDAFREGNIQIEHYVISTGLRQMVLGSRVAPFMHRVWGCEFLEREAPPGFLDGAAHAIGDGVISDIGYVIDHTTKTRAIFEINKGVWEGLGINVNAKIAPASRRVPFENMIYIADGPSDIPSFSIINQWGGKTFCVYQPESERDLTQATQMLEQNRAQAIGPTDYRPGTLTHEWLLRTIGQIAERLARSPPIDTTMVPVPPTPGHIYR